MPFTVEDESLRVDRKLRDLADFKSNLKVNMSRELLARLPAHFAQARILVPDVAIPHGNYWLLKGHFTRVNQGSRLLRSTVGFGAGGTKMETTTQGIGGIITLPFSGPMAITSLFSAVDGIRSGVSFDTARTARETTATLSEYLAQKNLLFNKTPLRPKKLGTLRLDILPSPKTKAPPAAPSKKTTSL